MKFKVTNWAEYDAGLRRRGSQTLWVTDEAIAGWQAAPRPTTGGLSFYSDLAIETGLMLRLAFQLPLRRTEGLMASVFDLIGVSATAEVGAPRNRQVQSAGVGPAADGQISY